MGNQSGGGGRSEISSYFEAFGSVALGKERIDFDIDTGADVKDESYNSVFTVDGNYYLSDTVQIEASSTVDDTDTLAAGLTINL